MLTRISTGLDRVSRAALILAAVGIIAMTVIVGWQVWARYVLNDTPHWSERLAIFIMNWFILIGAAVGVHERFHIGIVFFKEAMPTAIRYVLETIIHVATTAFGVAMIIYGLELADTTWTHIIPTLGIPVGLQYVPFGLSGGLIILFSLNHLADLFVNGLPPDMLGSKNPSEEGASE